MKPYLSLLAIVFIPYSLFSQTTFYTNEYNWDAEPKLIEIPEDLKSEPQVIVKDAFFSEFGYTPTGNFMEIRLTHRIVHVNSDDAIEENNKIYLLVSRGNTVLTQKARVIKASGKVVEMRQEDVKVAKDEKTGRSYEYFAVEDLALGDQVETITRMEYNPNYTGIIRYVQSKVPKLNYTFKLISPKHLEFVYKSYNGFPGLQTDTSSYKDKTSLFVEIPRVNKFKSETGANDVVNYMKVLYKLESNKASGKKNLVSYSDVAGRIYTRYVETSKQDMSIIKKIAKKIPLADAETDEQKARKIENYVKYNYSVTDDSYDELDNLSFVYENKIGSGTGMGKLYAGLFNLYKIPYEIVLTTDRSDSKFEPEFDAYCFLQEVLIYFPGFDKYLNPNDKFEVIGYLSPEFTNNNALFIEELNISGQKVGISRIGMIPFLDSKQTVDDLNLTVDMSKGLDDLNFILHKEITGYYAAATQPYYSLMDEDNLKNINEGHVKYIDKNLDIKKVESKNTAWGDFGNKPLLVDATFTSDQFMEKAGDNYLFKVGLLIGPQMELYAEEERTLPVEQDFCRKYHRTISFTIPDGYKVGNLKDSEIKKLFIRDGKELMGFISTATQKGQQITIDIVEYYDILDVPVAEYEMYRQVINAAADFNKVVLVLEKS